ncbi:MAG: lipase family protein [Enterovibrio sp.]
MAINNNRVNSSAHTINSIAPEEQQLIQLRQQVIGLEKKITKTTNNPTISQKLKKQHLRELKTQLSELKNKITLLELEITQSFEHSSFGRLIINIGGVLCWPITQAIKLANDHPYIAGGIVLGTAVCNAIAAPITTASAMNATREALELQKKSTPSTFQSTENQAAAAEVQAEAVDSSATTSDPKAKVSENQNIDATATGNQTAMAESGATNLSFNSTQTVSPNSGAAAHKLSFRTNNETLAEIHKVFDRHEYYNATEAAINGTIDLCEVLTFSRLASYPYDHDENKLPPGWKVDRNLTAQTIEKLGDAYKVNPEGVVTTAEGLTLAILTNETDVCISMGGTSAGDSGGNLFTRTALNPVHTLKQWFHNINHAIYEHYVPAPYEQAANLTAAVKELTNATVLTTGHSLGGGLSSYAAAMAGTPTEPMASMSFCSAQLGQKMHEELAKKCSSAEEAEQLISKLTHFTVKGDPVDSAGGSTSLLADISVLGKAYEIDPNSKTDGWWGWAKSLVTENAVALHGNYYLYFERLSKEINSNCTATDKSLTPKQNPEPTQPTASGQSWFSWWK